MTPTCRHLHTDGRPCGSPALRGEPFCFHHHTARASMPQRDRGPFAGPQLPAPDDFLAIQRGLGEVLRLLALDKLTDRRAQTLLNGLAKASANLARHHRREEKLAAEARTQGHAPAQPVTDFVNDEHYGTLALTPDEQAAIDQARAQSEAVPDPIPLLTPDPGHATSYEEASLHRMYERMSDSFRHDRLAFETAKQAELEATYQTKYEAKYEALYQARAQALETLFVHQAHLLQTRCQARLNRHAQTLEAQYKTRFQTRPNRQIKPQPNQYLRIKPQKLLQAPSALAS